mmetsp:Transcript_29768/g.63748  ORF Transcript_29768/g.63748 Transcript_29768/m.63748 type:complete len:120 (+) Transcript_29768:225-584(+)
MIMMYYQFVAKNRCVYCPSQYCCVQYSVIRCFVLIFYLFLYLLNGCHWTTQQCDAMRCMYRVVAAHSSFVFCSSKVAQGTRHVQQLFDSLRQGSTGSSLALLLSPFSLLAVLSGLWIPR